MKYHGDSCCTRLRIMECHIHQTSPHERILSQEDGAENLLSWNTVKQEAKLRIRDLAVHYHSSGVRHQVADVQAALDLAFLNGSLDTELIAKTPLPKWPSMIKFASAAALKQLAVKREEERRQAMEAAEKASANLQAHSDSIQAMSESHAASANVHWLSMQAGHRMSPLVPDEGY